MIRHKFTKKDREEAAFALSCIASGRSVDSGLDIGDFFDPGTPASDLAYSAFMAVPDYGNNGFTPFAEQWAEAESWVRTGWTP